MGQRGGAPSDLHTREHAAGEGSGPVSLLSSFFLNPSQRNRLKPPPPPPPNYFRTAADCAEKQGGACTPGKAPLPCDSPVPVTHGTPPWGPG